MDDSKPSMTGMLVARVRLFFSFFDPSLKTSIPAALVNWFVHHGDEPDTNTGMWVFEPEFEEDTHVWPVEVIHLDTILRGAHLLPCYGTGFLPEDFDYVDALDRFKSYYVNHFVDHHAHELLT